MAKQIIAFLLGAYEFRSMVTTHYDDLALADAYDWGRGWMHRITFRRFEREA